MSDIIIPIKKLSAAKQRLACVLSNSERAGLVLAMLKDLLTTATEIDRGRIWIVTDDDWIIDATCKFDVGLIREDHRRGYNSAVALGLSKIECLGGVAVLPGDIPLVTAEDILNLAKPPKERRLTIRLAPARDNQGTNGLYMSSLDLIYPCFGPQSFTKFQTAARSAGIEPDIIASPGMALDIDTPADLAELMIQEPKGATGVFLRTLDRDIFDPGSVRGAA